jgi:hypothetical protein
VRRTQPTLVRSPHRPSLACPSAFYCPIRSSLRKFSFFPLFFFFSPSYQKKTCTMWHVCICRCHLSSGGCSEPLVSERHFKLTNYPLPIAHQQVMRAELGINIVSLCQTWMRGGGAVGVAEFSVTSPHFQNRLVVVDAVKLAASCGCAAATAAVISSA